MKMERYIIAGLALTLSGLGCSKKDESKSSKSENSQAAQAATQATPAKSPTTVPSAKPGQTAVAATAPTTEAIEAGVAKLIDRMAAKAEAFAGKCKEQGEAMTAEGKAMKTEIAALAEQAEVLRAAGKLDLNTYKHAIDGVGKAPTQRFAAAIKGCESVSGLALMIVTAPVFGKDVTPMPEK